MKSQDWTWLAGLFALSVYVWFRDRTWWGAAEDVLPILAALPLMVWLGHPWKFQLIGKSFPKIGLLMLAAILLVLGAVLDLCLPAALAWIVVFGCWMGYRLEPAGRMRVCRLLPLALLAFPWVTLDFQLVGWWFRLSSAVTVENLFSWIGFSVTRTGVELLVQGLPISVDAACSGLKALQSLLIAGVALTYVIVGNSPHYWINLPLLIPLAWLANTARILSICVAAMTWGSDFAMGVFHAWGGLAVLVVMFGLCWALLRFQQKKLSRS